MMSGKLRNAVLAFRRLRRDEAGVAAVEFALVMPLLILLYVGSIEAAALFTVDKRVSSLSSTIGDLVAQWDPEDGDLTTGADSTLSNYMNASIGIMTPYPTTGIQIVVSMVQVKDDGATEVLWSTANAAGTAKTLNEEYDDASLDDTTRMNFVSRGGCVIAAEVTYAYLPLLGMVFDTALTLRHTNYFLPRYGSDDPIDIDASDPALASDACTNQA
jgi:Flp pilus assembly protein TadG